MCLYWRADRLGTYVSLRAPHQGPALFFHVHVRSNKTMEEMNFSRLVFFSFFFADDSSLQSSRRAFQGRSEGKGSLPRPALLGQPHRDACVRSAQGSAMQLGKSAFSKTTAIRLPWGSGEGGREIHPDKPSSPVLPRVVAWAGRVLCRAARGPAAIAANGTFDCDDN